MRVVILQPSFIPWRGYFDLIRRCDLFIFYDDVQYDRHGWRNRNRLKTPGGVRWLTIPVRSHNHLADQRTIREIAIDYNRAWHHKHWETIRQSYSRAPFFSRYAPLVEGFFREPPPLLADYTIQTGIALARELGLTHTRFARSSELGIPTDLGRNERLAAILAHVGATHYLTGPAARGYMDEEGLNRQGVTVEYMSYVYREYPQLYPPYDPALSILDLLFMTGPDAVSFFE